jgi:hypothetical protein
MPFSSRRYDAFGRSSQQIEFNLGVPLVNQF